MNAKLYIAVETNELIFKGGEFIAHGIVKRAREDAEEWKNNPKAQRRDQLQRKRQIHLLKITLRSVGKSSSGVVQVYVDEAWTQDGAQSGMGWVLRNHEG